VPPPAQAAQPPPYGYPQPPAAYSPPPGAGYGYAASPPTDGRAIAALVVGIVAGAGICAYGVVAVILGPIAIYLGLSSQRRIRAGGGALGGGGMAMAGWIIGMVATGVGAIYLLFFVVVFGMAIIGGMSHPSPSP
jgi:hypothetical protein